MNTKAMLTILVLCAPAGLAQEQAPRELEAPVSAVTVYTSDARVQRTSADVSASGTYVVRGLPGALDADSVRVRCEGGSVMSVEVRDRIEERVPEARIAELMAARTGLQRELEEERDKTAVLESMRDHLEGLMTGAGTSDRSSDVEGRPSRAAWQESYQFLSVRLLENRTAQREAQWGLEDLRTRLADLDTELGKHSRGERVRLNDVLVEVELSGPQGQLHVEYLVGSCGWKPRYELRTAGDARRVDVTYRAQVYQESSEDWENVELFLSTAEPRRGAQGPSPTLRWVGLYAEHAIRAGGRTITAELEMPEALDELEKVASTTAPPAATKLLPFASVQAEGLSLRYKLPLPETIESRPEPTTVLVGKFSLDVAPEYYCVPELDTTVWLRGIATNSGQWTLLSGEASVFFGEDFLGESRLKTVQPGAEFTLHLGASSAVSVERTQLEDRVEGPGFLGSKNTLVRAWNLRAANNGASVCAKDGSILLVVREALPRPTDDRIDVELKSSSPKPSGAERWQADRADKGITTWLLPVPRGGEVVLRWEVEVEYPKGRELSFR